VIVQIVAGGIVGGAPWLFGVAKYRGKVFRQPGGDASYVGRVSRGLRELIPRILGLRPSYYGNWMLAGLGLVVYLALIGALVVTAVTVARRHAAATPLGLFVTLALVFPIFVAIPPTASSTFEPRYALMLVPVAALLLAHMTSRLWIGAVVVLAALAFGTANVHYLLDFSHDQPAALDLTPSATAPLERALNARGITRVFADYWIANPLTFDGTHGIVASPLDLPRAAQPHATVVAARARDWVVYRNSNRARAIPPRLAKMGIHVTRRDVDVFTIYHLDRYIDPISLGRFWAEHIAGRL
jgi:hypothetical protein